MALPNITTADFTGLVAIATDRFTADSLQAFIDEYLPIYTRLLLGDDVADDIANTDPLPQKYTDLFDGVTYYNGDLGKTKTVQGLKRVLIRAIYFEFVRRQRYANSTVGTVVNNNENSQPQTGMAGGVQAVQRLAQGYQEYNREVIPFLDFYQKVQRRGSASAEVAGVYTITVANTIYLTVGDSIRIDSIDYEVSAVTSTDIEFTAPTGQDFTGKTVFWFPFEEAVYCPRFADLI